MSTTLLKTRARFANAALPKAQPSDQERAILALNPSLWIEADANYARFAADGTFRDIADRAGNRRYAPVTSNKPTLGVAGTKRSLVFAGIGPTGGSFALGPADGASVLTNLNVFTMIALTRLQNVAAAGDAVIGNGVAGNYAMLWQNQGANGGLGYFPSLAASTQSAGNLRDATWHILVVSVNAGAANKATMRVDGVQAQTPSTTVGAIPAATNAGLLYLGGAGAAGQGEPFKGEIGAAIVIPGLSLTDAGNEMALAQVESYFAALKAART